LFTKQEKEITCLEEYIKAIEEISNTEFNHFFRGQSSNKKYKLLPSFLRKNANGERKFSMEAEIQWIR